MSICIPKQYANNIRNIVATSKDTAERVQKFSEFFNGDIKKGQEINLLYEKSLLLKKQQSALDKFVDNITGANAETKAKMKQAIADNIERRNDIISNDDLLSISKDIFDKKYKLDIPPEIVQKMAKLRIEASNLKKNILDEMPDGSPERMVYGRKMIELSDEIDALANPTNTMNLLDTIKSGLKSDADRINNQTNPIMKIAESVRIAGDYATTAAYKGINASVDISYIFRQGYKVFAENPKIWANNVIKSLKLVKGVTKSVEKQSVLFNEFRANLVSSKNYQKAIDAGLAIDVIEDNFPTTIGQKVPILGRLIKASDSAFSAFAQGNRMALFDDIIAKNINGVADNPQLLKDFAKVINSITSRGGLGGLESQSGLLNRVFFSARYVKSAIDTFTMPINTSLSPEARAMAAKNSAKTLSLAFGLMATASQFTEVEFDPRSSKFGKARIPGTDRWFDLTVGLGSYVTLATKLSGAPLNFAKIDVKTIKSATSGKLSKINEGGFGVRTGIDILSDFALNKLAPAPATLRDMGRNKDFSGEAPTATSIGTSLFSPISPKNVYEFWTDESQSSNLVNAVSSILELTGVSNVDYSKFKK